MLGFGRKKSPISKEQALAAKPVRAVEGTLVPTADGGAKLQLPMRQTRWMGWLGRLPEGATKTFELDVMGVFVWNHCDGKTTVQQIIKKLAKEHGLTLREVEVATVRFLQMLVRKGLIAMAVPEKGKDEG